MDMRNNRNYLIIYKVNEQSSVVVSENYTKVRYCIITYFTYYSNRKMQRCILDSFSGTSLYGDNIKIVNTLTSLHRLWE